MSERALPIKVVYTVNPSPQPIVAYQKRTPVTIIPPLDGALGSSSLGFGQAPLKACLRAICSASPHLLSNLERDYSVYVLDPLEQAMALIPLPGSITGTQQIIQQDASTAPGVAVGMGLMSWCLSEEHDGNSEPTSVVGRLLNHPVSGEMVEVVVTLQETHSRSQEQINNRMKSWSAPSTAPASGGLASQGGSKRVKRVAALPTPRSTSSPAPPTLREVVDLTCDEPPPPTTSVKKRPSEAKKPNLTTNPLQGLHGPTPSPYQPHVYGSKALVPGPSRKATLSGAIAAKPAPIKRSSTLPVSSPPVDLCGPIALLPAPAYPFCPAVDVEIAGISAYAFGQVMTTAARLADSDPNRTIDTEVAHNLRAAFPQLFPSPRPRTTMPTSDAPRPTVTRPSSVVHISGSSDGTQATVSGLQRKKPMALLPPPNLSLSESSSHGRFALPEADSFEVDSSTEFPETSVSGGKEKVTRDVKTGGKKRRLSDHGEESCNPRKKLNSEGNIPSTFSANADVPGPSTLPAPPSTPRFKGRVANRTPSPTSSPLFSPDPHDLTSRVPTTPARVPTTPARPSGSTHRIFGSAHLSFSGMIETQPFFSPLRRTPGTTALLFEMGIGHLSSSPIRPSSPTPDGRGRTMPPSPWRSLQIDVGILPPSSPLPPTSSPARELGNPLDSDDADVKLESPVERLPSASGSQSHNDLSQSPSDEGESSRATSDDSLGSQGFTYVDDRTLIEDLDTGNYTHFESLWALFQPMMGPNSESADQAPLSEG